MESKTGRFLEKDKRILAELKNLHCDPHPFCTVLPSEADLSKYEWIILRLILMVMIEMKHFSHARLLHHPLRKYTCYHIMQCQINKQIQTEADISLLSLFCFILHKSYFFLVCFCTFLFIYLFFLRVCFVSR